MTMHLREQKTSGAYLLHLLNFKTPERVESIAVKLRLPHGVRLREAVMDSPDDQARQVLNVATAPEASFVVPQVKTYALVLLRTER